MVLKLIRDITNECPHGSDCSGFVSQVVSVNMNWEGKDLTFRVESICENGHRIVEEKCDDIKNYSRLHCYNQFIDTRTKADQDMAMFINTLRIGTGDSNAYGLDYLLS